MYSFQIVPRLFRGVQSELSCSYSTEDKFQFCATLWTLVKYKIWSDIILELMVGIHARFPRQIALGENASKEN